MCQQRFSGPQNVKIDIRVTNASVVVIGKIGYALVLTNEILSIKSDGQSQFESF